MKPTIDPNKDIAYFNGKAHPVSANEFLFVCDECGEEWEVGGPGCKSSEMAWDRLRAAGWRASNEGSIAAPRWSHRCTQCQQRDNAGLLDKPIGKYLR